MPNIDEDFEEIEEEELKGNEISVKEKEEAVGVEARKVFEEESLNYATTYIQQVKDFVIAGETLPANKTIKYQKWKEKHYPLAALMPLILTGGLVHNSLIITEVRGWRKKIESHYSFVKSYDDWYEHSVEDEDNTRLDLSEIAEKYSLSRDELPDSPGGLFLPHFGSHKVGVKWKRLNEEITPGHKLYFSYRQLWVTMERGTNSVLPRPVLMPVALTLYGQIGSNRERYYNILDSLYNDYIDGESRLVEDIG